MGLLPNPVCCAAKCCGCIILSQLIGLAISLGSIILFILVFQWYILPWGEDQIVKSLGLPAGTSYDSIDANTLAAQSCSGCVLGRNTDWPTKTTGTLHFLDTSAGTTISSTVATSLVASAAIGAGSMLWASIFPSMASVLSFTSGFYEMTHILEQAQHISMIGQLRLEGAPEFLIQFSKELSWTNFNIPKSVSSVFVPGTRRSLNDITNAGLAAVQPKFEGETGPAKYAKAIGVEPKNLFFYTLLLFGALIVVFHVLYVVWVMIVSCVSKKQSFGEVASSWYRKVVWAILLALLLAQYIFAMTGSYYIYENLRTSEAKDGNFVYGCIGLVVAIGFTALFGIAIIANNREELEDLGSYEHEQRPFAAKYSAYYDEYNFDNRYFFVPRIILAVATGVVVGIVQSPATQIFLILAITMAYLALLILREPNLLRFLYYIGIASVFMKVVLHCLMLLLIHDDVFPQDVRDKASYAIIGINITIFFLLFLRQAYMIVYKIVRACKNKDKGGDDDSDDDVYARRRDDRTPQQNAAGRYERMDSSAVERGNMRANPQNGPRGVADPYAQQHQQFQGGNLQQPYGKGNQQYGYGNGTAAAAVGVAVGAGAGYGASRQGGQQRSDGNGMANGRTGAAASGQDPRRMNGAEGYGAAAAVGAVGAAAATDAMGDRNSGPKKYNNQNGGLGAGVGASGQWQQGQSQVQEQQKPQPAWRRNMERRAAEAAAAEAASIQQTQPQHSAQGHTLPHQQRDGSSVRFGSDASAASAGRSVGELTGNRAAVGAGVAAAAAIGTAAALADRRSDQDKTNRPPLRGGSSGSSSDWFNQRAPSDIDSNGTSTAGQQRVLEFRDSDVGSYDNSATFNSNNDSFMSIDSYATTGDAPVSTAATLVNQGSFESSTSDAYPVMTRMDTRELDHLATSYLKDAANAAGTNDVDGEDEQEEEAPSVDIDGIQSDEDEDVDIDAMDDDDDSPGRARKESIDIDAEDDDAPVDSDEEGSLGVDDSHRGGTVVLARDDSTISINHIDEIDRQERDVNNASFLSAASFDDGRPSAQSEDDGASYYLDGRRDSQMVPPPRRV